MGSRTTTAADARYTAATIPASTLAGLVDYAAEKGRDAERWFAGCGLSAKQTFDPDAKLSFRQVARIVRRALNDFDGGLGLAIGSRATLPGLGVLGFSMMTSPTMADVKEVGQKYHPVSGSLVDVSCRTVDGELVLEAFERFPEPGILEFLCEKFFASALAATRALIGPHYRPLRLELAYPAPPHASAYRELFGCPVRFSAGHNRMFASMEVLGQPLPSHSPSTHAEALRLCESKMPQAAAAPDQVEALQHWLRERLGEAPTIAEAAAALHVHERTLRRHLQAAGTSFRAIHDRLRADRARSLLRDRALGIAEIAARLGFSDEREFRRAYRRWTGEVPSAARET